MGKFVKGMKRPPGAGPKKGQKYRKTVEIQAVIDQMVAYTDEHREAILDKVLETNPGLLVNFMGKIAPKTLEHRGDFAQTIVQLPKVEKPIEGNQQ